jgi:hypothetical protein
VTAHRNLFKASDYQAALEQAASRYHKLALVVGRPGSGKTALTKSICAQLQVPLLNLGLELSRKLLSLTIRERKLRASDIVADLLDSQEEARLAVDNTEIIFDPSLMLNPLGLLQSVSRTHLLIWSWNGAVEDGHITYAYPGHPEYHRISAADMTLIIP